LDKMESALAGKFENHRIVFWYDEHGDMRPEYEALDLPGVCKIELKNNAFGVKYHILREDKDSKFLVYHHGAEPKYQDNWLLDVQLANAVFSADRASLWLAELGLPPAFKSLVAEHEAFFQSNARLVALKERLEDKDSQLQVRLKMMAACLGSAVEPRVESILMVLLEELALKKTEKVDSLEKFSLLPHLWKELERLFGYQASAPHIKDFAIKLFESAFQKSLQEKTQINADALIFLNHWQDSLQGQKSYDLLAAQFEKSLNIAEKIKKTSTSDLLKSDIFKVFDHRILENTLEKVLDQTFTAEACQEIIRQRKTTHWYRGEIAAMYQALGKAAGLLELIRKTSFEMNNFLDGFTRYTKTWYLVDQLYREYVFHVRQSKENTFFGSLNELVEAHYCNNFLWVLNNNWQRVIDPIRNWKDLPVTLQRDFFQRYIPSILQSGAKVAVVISDALRYEVAEELAKRVEEAGRFTTELSAMVGMLPSYTALGMAALLPNKTLSIQADGNVSIDGMSSAGLENRAKILNQAVSGGTRAMLANEIKGMDHEDRRTLFRENQVIYVYHNQIDMVGDKRESEDQTFEAVDAALEDLVELIKLLRSANFAKILVTADHGFLYQHKKLSEADLTGPEIAGKEIILKKRRFAIGRDLEDPGAELKLFSADQLGLSGNFDVLLAKSVNRLRLSGAGMQFVHGGSSLQEIVIPVLAVNKVRGQEFGIRKVEVDRLSSATTTITTGQLTVKFLQTEKISPKAAPRTLRVGIFADDGSMISETKTLYFGFDSEQQRDRELQVTLLLSKDWQKYNRQNVQLRLEEPITDTDRYELYKNWQYYLNKTQFADF